jgi:CRP-like cAMP-binding protein
VAKTRPVAPQSPNALLSRLPAAEYERLSRRLRAVPLKFNQVLAQARQAIDYVYCPTSGVVSPLIVMEGGAGIEVVNIGREVMAGASAILGVLESPHQNLVQVAGSALRMDAQVLARECEQDGPLRRLLFRYHAYFLFQVSQSVACNGLHAAGPRCCRWLLMTHDRVDGDVLTLTHEFLALMLGVRRVSVTLVLQPLQEQGLIRIGHGRITVLDRRGLEVAACECYQAVRDEYARLIG